MGLFDFGYDEGPVWARRIKVNTSLFSGNLNYLDIDVQHALNTLDQLVIVPAVSDYPIQLAFALMGA